MPGGSGSLRQTPLAPPPLQPTRHEELGQDPGVPPAPDSLQDHGAADPSERLRCEDGAGTGTKKQELGVLGRGRWQESALTKGCGRRTDQGTCPKHHGERNGLPGWSERRTNPRSPGWRRREARDEVAPGSPASRRDGTRWFVPADLRRFWH
ncbi:uncharacterized protein LOC126645806 isoform X4 [Myiozetetes cayanensis]|uniref:uncharacterized protein LOC126645806 isoform X4 n=1 Tax=Myiozetetes cayanensis TaxID=478635 RepID=UPI00215F8DF5|nr:uncharacterized protein LOC126645806 isoform X4 [Myiozetetes cayanensis]XP_050182573.1 uncharacterized protein LOC126645806 isoform X4 [Myiozetetes cayanensis]